MTLFQLPDISVFQWVAIAFTAIVIGFSKTGLSGLLMMATAIMASVFGGKETTGIILPMLVFGDIFAVAFYRHNAEWRSIIRLLPWTVAGFILGIIVGNLIDDRQFKTLIALSVIICLAVLVFLEYKGEKFKVPTGTWFYILTGIASGFTSMIGNAAVPIFSVYLLAMGYKKKEFMGTSAVFFMIVNLLKLPLQILFWHNISTGTFAQAMVMIPLIAAGAIFGLYVNKKINEKPFRYLIMIITAAAAFRLLFL